MGEEIKCLDRDRCDRDRCDRDYKDRHPGPGCDCHPVPDCDCHENDDEWDIFTWILIIVGIFLLCGGTNIFGGNGCGKDDCCDGGGSGIWILIIILVFLFLGNQNDCKGGGFLGGLFN